MKNAKFYISLLLICWTVTGCVKESEGNVLKKGDTIPSFSVGGPEGSFSSSEFSGKGGVLVFFASYCPTCQTVLPEIDKVWKASGEGSDFAVAALSRQGVYEEDEESVAVYWDTSRYSMPYYLDIEGEVYYRFAKETIPRVYVINAKGEITYMSVGDGNLKAGKIAAELENALGRHIDL